MYHLDEELDTVLAFQVLVGQRRRGPAGGASAHTRKGSVVGKGTGNSCSEEGTAVAAVKLKRDEKTGALVRA